MDHPNRKAIFSGKYTQMAIVCSCHPTFEEVCVVELGHEIEKIDHSLTLPLLKLKGDNTCVKNFTGPYCSDYGWEGDTRRESYNYGTTQEVVNF